MKRGEEWETGGKAEGTGEWKRNHGRKIEWGTEIRAEGTGESKEEERRKK